MEKLVPSYAYIKSLCKEKRLKEALEWLFAANRQGFKLKPDSVAETLLLCASEGAIDEGRQLHALVRRNAVYPTRYLLNNLLNMYLKCGSLDEGKQVFEEMPIRHTVSWNAMIAGYANNGHVFEAIKLFWQMQEENVEPNRNTFVCILSACVPPVCVDQAFCIHSLIVMYDFDKNVRIGSALNGMYFRYTKLFDAYCVFEDMIERDLLIWTSMMKGYSDCGYGDEALCLVQKMLHECMFPDKVFFMNALCGCRSLGLLRSGLLLHLFIINANVDLDPLLGSSLVNMYAKFGSMQLVYNFFDKVNIKDTAFWTALLSGYEQQGENQKVLLVFSYMSTSAVHLNEASLLSAMQACTDLPTLDLGVLVHSIIVESGFESNAHLVNALIEMYARYGKEKDMHVVLKLSNRDAVTGNSIIDGVTKD